SHRLKAPQRGSGTGAPGGPSAPSPGGGFGRPTRRLAGSVVGNSRPVDGPAGGVSPFSGPGSRPLCRGPHLPGNRGSAPGTGRPGRGDRGAAAGSRGQPGGGRGGPSLRGGPVGFRGAGGGIRGGRRARLYRCPVRFRGAGRGPAYGHSPRIWYG